LLEENDVCFWNMVKNHFRKNWAHKKTGVINTKVKTPGKPRVLGGVTPQGRTRVDFQEHVTRKRTSEGFPERPRRRVEKKRK